MKRGEKLWRKMSRVCQWRTFICIPKTASERKPKCRFLSNGIAVNCRMSRCPAISQSVPKEMA